jgi:hypothetical protein
LLHIFSLGIQPECQHIFGKQTGIYVRFRSPSFGPQKTITTWLTKTEIFTFHWINIIIRNNKCIFTKLNAVFKLKTVVWTKKISTPTTQFVQRVQLSSEETVQWHKLWQLPDTNLPRLLQYCHGMCFRASSVFVLSILFWFPQRTHYFWRVFWFLFMEHKQYESWHL